MTAESTSSTTGSPPAHSEGVLPLHAWGLGLVLGVVLYCCTAAPGVLWGDSGQIQLQILLDGWYVDGQIVRSHVLFTAVARFLCWLLPFDAAYVGNLTAALAGAITIANVAWVNAHMTRRLFPVIVGTAVLLFSHTIWQLSTSAEVITLTTALLSAELVFFLKLTETRRLRWLAALALANGLGLSNHNFALLMWPIYGVVAILSWRAWSGARLKMSAIAVSSLLLGAAPVLALCVHDFLSQGSLLATLTSFLVGHYGHSVMNIGALDSLLFRSVAIMALNFPTPLVLLVVPGIWFVARSGRRSIAVLLIGGAMVYALFALRYNVPDQHTFFVPFFVFVSVFLALGAKACLAPRRRAWRMVAVILTLGGPLAYAVGPPVLKYVAPDTELMPSREVPYRERFAWFIRPWRNGEDGPERYAKETLASLPTDAVLSLDMTLAPPLAYVQQRDRFRRDIRLDATHALQDWFHPDELEPARIRALRAGNLYVGCDQRAYWPKWLRRHSVRPERFGHVYKVESVTEGKASYSPLPPRRSR